MTVRWCALMPGHGGSDCGADYAGAYEKDETLLIARLVRRHLESVGVKVLTDKRCGYLSGT